MMAMVQWYQNDDGRDRDQGVNEAGVGDENG